jgi:hypothetical protein
VPTYTCRRTSSPIVVDGVLDQAWSHAEAASLRRYDDSGQPSMATIARLCYDDNYLYVAFQCQDTELQASMLNRDDPIYNEEVVEVFLDPDSDELTYYEFEVSPLNVIFDATVLNPTGVSPEIDTSWDCPGLLTAVKVDDQKNWVVEIAIPFSSIDAIPPKPGDEWRVNLYRIERVPRVDFNCWSPTIAEPPNFHIPSKFGILRFE